MAMVLSELGRRASTSSSIRIIRSFSSSSSLQNPQIEQQHQLLNLFSAINQAFHISLDTNSRSLNLISFLSKKKKEKKKWFSSAKGDTIFKNWHLLEIFSKTNIWHATSVAGVSPYPMWRLHWRMSVFLRPGIGNPEWRIYIFWLSVLYPRLSTLGKDFFLTFLLCLRLTTPDKTHLDIFAQS